MEIDNFTHVVFLFANLLCVVNGQCSDSTRPLTLLGQNGTITSPSYPSNYNNSVSCQWLFSSQSPNEMVAPTPRTVRVMPTPEIQDDGLENESVELTITDLCTEGSFDKIRIYDGNSTFSPLITDASGCANLTDLTYRTSQENMLVWFTSDNSVTYRGFTAGYSSVAGDQTTAGGAACSPSSRPLVLLEASGTISSPNYPDNYVNNVNCQWLITGPQENSIIVMNFTDFCTESSWDSVNIYDGDNVTSPTIVSLSGCLTSSVRQSETPQSLVPYTSSQRFVLVKFSSDFSVVRGGFNAMYTASSDTPGSACSASAQPASLSVGTDESGVIESPLYPFSYPNNAMCQWRIVSSIPTQVVKINFTNFCIENRYDSVSLYDGASSTDPLIASLTGCQLSVLRIFISTQDTMLVQFTSDSSIVYSGFSATYTSISVGGDACLASTRPFALIAGSYGSGGSLTSPNNPHSYVNNADCQWTITAEDPTNIVRLSINAFCTELRFDYLSLYDGCSMTSPLIAQLTGCTVSPVSYSSSQNCMSVRFTSDASVVLSGYSALYSSEPVAGGACSSSTGPLTLNAITGSFSSPLYPHSYGNNASCQWLIQPVSAGMLIRISITDLCTESEWDSVRLYDGNSASDSLIASLTGCSNTTTCYTTSNGPMYVSFSSDLSYVNRGFNITYASVPGYDITACSPTRPLVAYADNNNGTITSPSYPCNYNNLADCQWLITSYIETSPVTLCFNAFCTENSFDSVRIYDGSTRESPLISSLTGCSLSSSCYMTTQRFMLVSFTADSSVVSTGFTATYFAAPVGASRACNPTYRPLVLDAGIGAITSHGYPDNYINNEYCQWRIVTSQSDAIIRLTFNSFISENRWDEVCLAEDFSSPVSVSDLYSYPIACVSGPTLAASTYRTTGTAMLVSFSTDVSLTYQGFSASYASQQATIGQECSYTTGPLVLTASTGTISSAYWPDNYVNNLNCSWNIQGSTSQATITLSFQSADLENSYDFVRVYDGCGTLMSVIGQLSGSNPSVTTFTSVQNCMSVQFVTDVSYVNHGFTASYTISMLFVFGYVKMLEVCSRRW